MEKKYDIPKDALVIMLGIAGVGKTTLAHKLAQSLLGEEYDDKAVISSDAIRKELYGSEAEQGNPTEVFDIFNKRIEERLEAKKLAIADATNLNDQARRGLYKMASNHNRAVYVLVFNVPLDIAKKQNALRERKVPEEVLEKQFDNLRRVYGLLPYEEGLPSDHIIDIAITNDREKEINEKYQKMKDSEMGI